jgi:hypothetical protein
MALKTYRSIPVDFKVGYGTEDVSIGTQKKSTKIIEFVDQTYSTSDEDEQAFLEGEQFARQVTVVE